MRGQFQKRLQNKPPVKQAFVGHTQTLRLEDLIPKEEKIKI